MSEQQNIHERSVANRAVRLQHDNWAIPSSIVDRIEAMLDDIWPD